MSTAVEEPAKYAVVMARIGIGPLSSVEIFPGYILRRAQPSESREITILSSNARLAVGSSPPATLDWELAPDGSKKVVELPPEKWNHYIITAPRPAGALRFHDIQEASLLTPTYFRLPLIIHSPSSCSFEWVPHHLQPGWWMDEPSKAFGEAEAAEIRAVYESLVRLKGTHPDLLHAFELFRTANDLRPGSRPRLLELFAVFEALLTHEWENDRGQASTQITKKTALLLRRMADGFRFDLFPDLKSPDHCWDRLFALRNRLAHGRSVNFADNRKGEGYKDLVSVAAIDSFLFDAGRRLLRHGLSEPDLVADLRDC